MFCSEVHGYLKDRETDLLSLVEVLDEELDDEEDDIFLLLEELEKVGHVSRVSQVSRYIIFTFLHSNSWRVIAETTKEC